jgi:C1A family cysteine protease
VNPIKDEVTCPSGFLFSAVSAQESQWFLTNNVLYSLSEQNLVDCYKGCLPEDPYMAYEYVVQAQNGQFALDSDYPYKAYEGSCKWDPSKGITKVRAYITIREADEEDLLHTVYSNGPASVMVDGSSLTFQFYTSGVFDEPTCSDVMLGQPLTVVGWGVSDGAPYWLARNSWGPEWGLTGYIWMSRNKKNQCGIASMAIVPIDV